MGRQSNQESEPRRIHERQGLQTGEEREAEERNAPYEPPSAGAGKAMERGDYGPKPTRTGVGAPPGLAKEKRSEEW